jgi:hypothetical protein
VEHWIRSYGCAASAVVGWLCRKRCRRSACVVDTPTLKFCRPSSRKFESRQSPGQRDGTMATSLPSPRGHRLSRTRTRRQESTRLLHARCHKLSPFSDHCSTGHNRDRPSYNQQSNTRDWQSHKTRPAWIRPMSWNETSKS